MAQSVLGKKSLGDLSLSSDLAFKAESVLHDRKNSNQIIDLLGLLLLENEKDVLTALDCLQKVFTGFLNSGDILEHNAASSDTGCGTIDQYKYWLYEQYGETKRQCLTLLNHPKRKVQQLSAETLLSFLVIESDKRKKTGLLKKVMSNLLSSKHNMKAAIGVFTEDTLDISLKLRILEAVRASLKGKTDQSSSDVYLLNVYSFLKFNWFPKKSKPEDDDDSQLKSLKYHYTEAWIEFLKFKIPFSIYKSVLVNLHEMVLPNMKTPLIFTDFLSDSYNFGGAISLLSLNGLFFLMQKCNLEYPNFFEKLYSLLTGDIFHAKYRPQFFYLMDLFLSSLHVPAYLIGAFVKKLSRLSLAAPPDALLLVLPFLKNLLIRHPALRVLMNRRDVSAVSNDPYLPEEHCISKCRAMESSLWEVKTLQQHWHPAVAKEAMFVNKSLPQMERDLAEVLATDFTELFNSEVETELQKIPLSYDVPKGLFNRTEDKMSSWWAAG